MNAKVAIIIVAGGSGSRMGGDTPKQFLLLRGEPVLVHTVRRFVAALPDATFVVVLPGRDLARWEAICADYGVNIPHCVVSGGAARSDSVRRGLAVAGGDAEWVLVHDGVRPLVSGALIKRVLETARKYGTAVPVVDPADSFRFVPEGILFPGGESVPLDRTRLRAVQTPQGFAGSILRNAYSADADVATDDATLVERSGIPVTLCEGDPCNLKITTPADLCCAEAWLTLSLP